DNSKGQNPCLVAAYVCSMCSNSLATVDPLQPNHYFPGPTIDGANPCTCSSITYNLFAACTLCQNNTYLGTWGYWSTNCSTAYPGVPYDLH
ncbi:hypothetical protein SCLCIDRAFT_1147853, partial [Scleroderma citrinum Foug A]